MKSQTLEKIEIGQLIDERRLSALTDNRHGPEFPGCLAGRIPHSKHGSRRADACETMVSQAFGFQAWSCHPPLFGIAWEAHSLPAWATAGTAQNPDHLNGLVGYLFHRDRVCNRDDQPDHMALSYGPGTWAPVSRTPPP